MYEQRQKRKENNKRVTRSNDEASNSRAKRDDSLCFSNDLLQRQQMGLRGRFFHTSFRPRPNIIQMETVDDESSLDKIKSSTKTIMLEQDDLPAGIYSDKRGIYGYLPKEGSRYDNPLYDFSDADFVARNRKIRLDYVQVSKQLESAISVMRGQGKSSEEIARRVVMQRNTQKIEARALMSRAEVTVLEAENIKRYRNPIGPTPDDLYSKFGDWELIIKKSMKKDPEINYLLGVTPDL